MDTKVILDTNVIASKHLSPSSDSPARKIIEQWRNQVFDLLYFGSTSIPNSSAASLCLRSAETKQSALSSNATAR